MTETRRSPLFVNLLGGPCTCKSAISGYLFSECKFDMVSVELVTEYPKDLVWERSFDKLAHQPIVSAKQWYRGARVQDKVEVVVTDSPIILGSLYKGIGYDEHFEKWILARFNERDNLNIFLERNPDPKYYDTAGRMQTFEESQKADSELKALLNGFGIPYVSLTVVGRETRDACYELLKETLIAKRAEALKERQDNCTSPYVRIKDGKTTCAVCGREGGGCRWRQSERNRQ